jgi:hypothetical protein
VLDAEKLPLAETTLTNFPNPVVMYGPSIQTWSRMRGEVSVGNTISVAGKPTFAGVLLDSYPVIRAGGVDLLSTFLFTEAVTNNPSLVSVKTNLMVRSRVRIPKGGGALIMNGNQADRTTAVLITATVR